MFNQFSDAEIARAIQLRALEWDAWPAFLAQPILPLAYLYRDFATPIFAVVVACLLWAPFKSRWASFRAATVGCFFVRLKWLTIPSVTLIFLTHRRWDAAVVTITIPLYVAFLNLHRGRLGRLEARMYASLAAASTESSRWC